MPAAAVIPAPRVSTVDAAVKGSVVGLRRKGAARRRTGRRGLRSGRGARYGRARDEMPGPCLDRRRRRRRARTRLGMKGEGRRSEGD